MLLLARVFLSPDNAIGFGFVDFLELAAAALLAFLLPRRWSMPAAVTRIAARTGWAMPILFTLPIVLRLLLLARSPVPTPSGADDFSYVLLADTFRHLRLANPPHALPEFFEQVFVLQRPTYSSIFPPGQGIALAAGWIIFGHPWAGVLLSIGALCAFCYWMLRAWTTPMWAFVGGLLAVIEFGPLSYWANSYWGGALSALAGCLVFGALPRLLPQLIESRHPTVTNRLGDAACLGAGLALELWTRPYEFVLLVFSVFLFFAAGRQVHWRRIVPAIAIVLLCVAAAGGFMLLQNQRVTGNWRTLPYLLYRYDYGVPATFTFQPNAVPHRPLNEEEELDYRAQSAIHGEGSDTFGRYLERLLFRARFCRFFLLAPLFLAFAAFAVTAREFRFLCVLLTLLLFALGTNIYPYFYPHYIAAITCLFVLASVIGLEKLNRLSHRIPVALLLVCFLQFAFWFGAHAFGSDRLLAWAGRVETWDFINWGDAEGRLQIQHELQRQPGKQLVFVRYAPQHAFREWVHNAADIDRASIVWAHDLGAIQNRQLIEYYPDRKTYLLTPDNWPLKLAPYVAEMPRFEDVR